MTPERGFEWPVRVYYEDTDAAGIVYHANYLRFMERARTEWLRDLGFEQDVLRARQGVIFVITHADVHYLGAARFNQELVVTTRLERVRRASISFQQAVAAPDGRALCRAVNAIACVDATDLKPRRIPGDLMRKFERAK